MLLCSPFNSRSRVAWWSAVAFALIVVPAQPQEKSLPAGGLQKTQAKAAVTVKLIEARIASAKQGPALKDKPDALKRVLALYEQAKTHLDRAAGFRKQLAGFQTLQKNVAALVEEQRRKLERPISDPDDDVPRETPLDELEQKLASARQRLKTAQQSLAGLESLRKTRAVRRTDVPRRLAAAKKELAAVDVALSAKPAPGELPEAALAQQTVQQAKRQNLTAEIAALEAEVPTYDITAALLKLQIQVADRDVQRAERAAKFWEKLVEERRGSEADQQQRAASDLLRQLRDNALPKRLIALAEENLKFAKRRTGPDGLVVRIRQATASRHVTDDRLKALQAARKDIDEKLKIPGIEDVIGQLLLDQRRQLPNAGPYERSIGKRRRELSLVRLDLLRLQKEADPYSGAKVDESIRRVTASLAASRGGADRDNLEQWVRAVLTQRQKLLESLIGDETSLLKHLTELSATERQLVDTGADFQRLIDKHILWVRSTLPLESEDFPRAGTALAWAFSVEQWRGVWDSLWMSLLARPVVSALAIFLLTLMLLKEVAFKRALDAVGDRAAQGFTQPFHLTGQALGLTLLLAAQWAAVLWFLGWHLSTYSDSTAFAASVGSAMQTVAATLLTLEFLRRMFRPQGLAAAHFRWRDARLLTIRRHLRWFELLALPAVFLFALTADSGSEAYASSLGRLLLIGLLLLVGAFLAIVLRRRPSLQSAHAAEHSVARRDRTTVQTAAYLCAVGLPILLAVFTGAGYLYTATLLTTKLLQSIWLAVLLLVLHATALRWLYHARGRLALERIRAAQAANSEDDAAGDAKPVADESGGPASGMDVELEAPRAADMATINAQTRRLLKIVVAGGAVLGAWMIWADVIPALRFLDFALWSTQIETTRMVPGPDGTQVPESAVRIRVFTLGHLFTALAVLVVSFLAAGNIPGLLEVGVLQRLPIDSGARYAATSVARYAIYIVGIVTAFNLIGVGWDKVQWLVAALGVGLGFGLQEIVANWVSGIILLFERPLRVGDIVTVGDVTGVVTRIQIRATTIRNWDRKEFIVPNKELITGKLMNWTLSDQTNRVVINIGVAYGSDTERVRRLLQEILAGHPNVSKDPAPMVTFEGFGDSALNFVVRCYLPSLEQRLNTVHDLHHEIHRRFADEGIEIAFPQMDLHLRSDEAHTNGPPSTPATESRPPQRNGTDGEPAVPRAEGKSAG